MRIIFKKAAIIFSFSIVILLMMYCGNDQQKTTVAAAPDPYLNHSDTAHYVGMSQCRLCHQKIYDSFIETGMGKSFDHATKKNVSNETKKNDSHTLPYNILKPRIWAFFSSI